MIASLSLDRTAIESLIRWYCREAGVRNLNKHIEKITRKLALQIVAEGEGTELTEKSARESETWTVTETNLHEYVGPPIFTSDRLYENDPLPHGIAMGLAWTAMGGSTIYVETQAIKKGLDSEGKPKGGGILKVTGQLGKVMEESTQIAYTLARAKLSDILPSSSYYDDVDVHMYVHSFVTFVLGY
jgi:Lon-like ATP-dependent protease